MSAYNRTCATRRDGVATIARKGLSRLRFTWATEGPKGPLRELWMRFWMVFAGRGFLGRMASRFAAYFAPPYHSKRVLAWMNRKGYVSATSTIQHNLLRLGDHVFVDDEVVIYQDAYLGIPGGEVTIGDRVSLYDAVTIQTGDGGRVVIGDSTFIHTGCIIAAYKGSVIIGREVMIAPNCSFYPYNHGIVPGIPMAEQPLTSRGDTIIEDEAWISTGVIILDGVRVGKGAVVGAGSLVTRDIPDNAIAYGVPAKVIKMRGD